MKFVHKTLGLLLASLALSSCGGGGGDGNGAFEPPQSGSITLTPPGGSTMLPLNSIGAGVVARFALHRMRWISIGPMPTARPFPGTT